MMDVETGVIVISATIDKRETGGNSVRMELVGCMRCLYDVLKAGVLVDKLVTDDHNSIRKFFSK